MHLGELGLAGVETNLLHKQQFVLYPHECGKLRLCTHVYSLQCNLCTLKLRNYHASMQVGSGTYGTWFLEQMGKQIGITFPDYSCALRHSS